MSLIWWAGVAMAADVVWLGAPPPAELEARLLATAGAEASLISPSELISASVADPAQVAARWSALDKAVEDARPFETRLDGELVIMRDLQGPLDRLLLVRNQKDRDAWFSALAYQGFAVDRFYGDALATDPEAAEWRVELESGAVEAPWFDAVAIAPKKDVTPYEIAEAPQRVAYGRVREQAGRVLPASLDVSGLPEGTLMVDGMAVDDGGTGTVRVPAGRHLVHLEKDGALLARWDLRLPAAGNETLSVAVSQKDVLGWLGRLEAGGPVPDGLTTLIESVGGELWVARAGKKDAEVLRVAGGAVTSVELTPMSTGADDDADGFSVATGVAVGWFQSGDFYLQDPANAPHETATVNALAPQFSLEAAYDVGMLRIVAGGDVYVPLGEFAIAKTGASQLRARPSPFVGAGVSVAQVTAGWVFPYHPAIGVRSALPLSGALELRVAGTVGLPLERARDDGSVYRSEPLGILTVGIGGRLRP